MVVPDPDRRGVRDDAVYRAFFEATPAGLILLDGGRRIQAANAAATKLFGHALVEPPGRSFGDLLATAAAEAAERAFSQAASQGCSAAVAVDARGSAGAVIAVELTITRIRTPSADSYGVEVRELHRDPRSTEPARGTSGPGTSPSYSVAELLMANRLRDLV
jgi:PAS domain S-box-containing protein